VLQLAGDDEEEARFATIVRSHGYPAEFLEFADRERASSIAGRAVSRGGWWFPQGGVVAPAQMLAASLARSENAPRTLAGRRVERIEREAREWRVLDASDRVIAEAPTLILANASDARRLLPEAALRLSAVRGQVTYLAADPSRCLGVVVSGNGYVTPLPDGAHAIGATYRHDDSDAAVRVSEHIENLARAESMLPGFTEGVEPSTLAGWVGYRTTVPDRLPIHGATTVEGVYTATGLGSRGLLWAPLGAEHLAATLEGEPWPVPRDLAGAISPRRFLS
jgi:tRNA 5-methylaminomethyl-2-thiouridine biosynthesis bifunctional protein